MTGISVAERLAALDLERCTEEERQSAILEISLALEEIGQKRKSTETIMARMQLLRMWHTLAKLRVADVQADVAPPEDPIDPATRLFPEEEPVEGDEIELVEDEVLEEPPLEMENYTRTEELIPVRLMEAGIVNGMRLPAGIVVDVPLADADILIATGRARYLEEDESKS